MRLILESVRVQAVGEDLQTAVIRMLRLAGNVWASEPPGTERGPSSEASRQHPDQFSRLGTSAWQGVQRALEGRRSRSERGYAMVSGRQQSCRAKQKEPGTFASTGSSILSKVLDPLHKGNAGDRNGSACTDNSVISD